jgi:purine catabolism regulator
MVSIKSLLAGVLPATARVLGGAAGLQGQVTWAATMRTRPPAFEALRGGEAALLSLSALHALQAVERSLTLARVMETLAEARVAAVLVGGVDEGAVSAELQKAIALADEYALPLIALPRPPLLADVERDIITAVVNQRDGLDQRATAIYQEFLALSLRRAGIAAMIERLMLVLEKVVVLEDEAGQVIHAASPGEASLANQVTLERAIKMQPARALFPGAGFGGTERPQISGVKPTGLQPLMEQHAIEALGKMRLVTPLRLGLEVVGFCSVMAEAQQLEALDRLVLGQVAPLLALELGRVRELAEVEQRLHGDVLDEVLEGNEGDQGQALQRARQLGYDLERTLVVALVVLPEDEAYARTREQRDAFDAPSRLARQVMSEAERCFPGLLMRRRAWEVFLLLPVEGAERGGPLPMRFRERLSEFLGRLDRRDQEAGLRMGISRPAGAAAELGRRAREARQAVMIGRRVLSQHPLTFFGDLGIYRLLFYLDGQAEARGFYEETLGPLIAYDLRTQSELVQTLERYFVCNGNLSQAAQQLHLHRNSLLYRLERIGEVLRVDLDDAETRLSLQVALRMRHLFTE